MNDFDESGPVKLTPVVLCGGSGMRLWPLSRKAYPKQFSKLIGEKSLFQQTAHRLLSSNKVSFNPHITITNSDFRFIVCEQLQELGIEPSSIIIEPEGKNTAPAILAAVYFAMQNDPNVILLIAPSDHIIPDVSAFHDAIHSGISDVEAGNIVTFGIKPSRPETGYGYLELSKLGTSGPTKLKRFLEKPDSTTAQAMLEAGTYLWNAGIFMFRAKDMCKAFQKYAPNLTEPIRNSIELGKSDLGFFRLDPNAWSEVAPISIDYAIMEHADNLTAVPFTSHWSDLGEWNSVWAEQNQDHNGVATSANATAIDCTNTLLRSESDTQQIVGLGLKDIIAIAMPDAVLVVQKDRVQDVKKVVEKLKLKGVSQAEIFPKDHRPWGWFETLAIAGRFQVKRIVVKPGAALSLQSHNHRSEHWVVVEGTAKVTINDQVSLVTEGQSVYIPVGAIHRMENPGKLPMLLIEVQTGPYLEEDDIVRYEDIYDRDSQLK